MQEESTMGKASTQAATQPPPDDSQAQEPEPNRPVHVVRLRNIRAAIWANETETGVRHNVTLTRLYRDEQGHWHDSDSFRRDDLLLLAKVVDLAHTWISERSQDPHSPF
jgi:hypothetical protein